MIIRNTAFNWKSIRAQQQQLLAAAMTSNLPSRRTLPLAMTCDSKSGKGSSDSKITSLSLCPDAIPDSPDFPAFSKFKNEVTEEHPSIFRLDCMKPFIAVSHLLEKQPLFCAPYMQNIGDSLRNAWALTMGASDPAHLVITKGVRDGIYLSLVAAAGTQDQVVNDAGCDEVIWPNDVYPVYERIIDKAFAHIAGSVKRTSLPTNSLLNPAVDLASASPRAVLLLTAPLTPLGRVLSAQEINSLCQWVHAFPQRKIIFDCVYSYNIGADCTAMSALRRSPQVVMLHSLAKSWLSPTMEPLSVTFTQPQQGSTNAAAAAVAASVDTKNTIASFSISTTAMVPRETFSRGVGFLHCSDTSFVSKVKTIVEGYNMSCSLKAQTQALHLMHNQPCLPQQQQARFSKQWDILASRIKDVHPSFAPPSSGYFAILPVTYKSTLLKHRVLGVPRSVFGNSRSHSNNSLGDNSAEREPVGELGNLTQDNENTVISCLYYIKDADTKEGLSASASGLSAAPRCQEMYHVTTLSNFVKGYEKYTRFYSKSNIPQSTFPDQFFLLHSDQVNTGIEKAVKLINKLSLPDDALLVLHTKCDSHKTPLIPHPRGQYIEENKIKISGLSVLRNGEELTKISVEEAYAASLKTNGDHMHSYAEVRPRSVSVLPIAKGCQARCAFCFSKGSVSADMKQKYLDESFVNKALLESKKRGAERAVITGGGEPFMLPYNRLLSLIKQCSIFPNVCLISNGYYLTEKNEKDRMQTLKELDDSGLTVLSISRHAPTDQQNEAVMQLKIPGMDIAHTWRRGMESNEFKHLKRFRWICVLQKGSVHDEESLREYLDFAAESGAPEICFKELYVSTSEESVFHDSSSNKWSEENQVPLSVVIEFLEAHNFIKSGELPWGAPLYDGEWQGHKLRIAAYTEPSVYWERINGVCRSWNIMANGTIYASLEDKASDITLPTN